MRSKNWITMKHRTWRLSLSRRIAKTERWRHRQTLTVAFQPTTAHPSISQSPSPLSATCKFTAWCKRPGRRSLSVKKMPFILATKFAKYQSWSLESRDLSQDMVFMYRSWISLFIFVYVLLCVWLYIACMCSIRTATSFSALTLLVGSFEPVKPVPDMTYNVFSGTLNPTQSILDQSRHLYALSWLCLEFSYLVMSHVSWLCLDCVSVRHSWVLILCWNTGISCWQ